jgi:hypothetical protein
MAIYHEVAIEPTAFQDWKDVGLIERMFGFEHGRLVSYLPAKKGERGDWPLLFLDHMKEKAPGKGKELELLLLRLKQKCLFRSRNRSQFEADETWIDVALAEHASEAFSAVLTERSEDVESPCFPFQYLHEQEESLPDFLRDAVHVTDSEKDPGVFLQNLQPLICSAKRIAFIDPYFNPTGVNQNWKNTVRDLAKYLRESNRTRIDLEFHTGCPENLDGNAHVRAIQSEIEGHFPSVTKLAVSSWSQKYKGPRFHARYLITDKGGVGLDYGFDLNANQRTDVALLPLAKATERLGEFDVSAPSTFILDGTTAGKGTRAIN